MPKVFFTGPGPDAVEIGRSVFVRDGDGVEVDAELSKELLKRDDFQSSAPSRKDPKVETPDEDK